MVSGIRRLYGDNYRDLFPHSGTRALLGLAFSVGLTVRNFGKIRFHFVGFLLY